MNSQSAAAALPRVVIVGRPNVGKSSLFNRIVGQRRAIIEDEPGTTRDRVEAEVEWLDRRFVLVDTGGFQLEGEDAYAALIVDQVRAAIDDAALVLFCVDARDGLIASDYDVADVVRRSARPVIVVATKADNDARQLMGFADAGRLGFGAPIPVSALHDVNVGLLLDEVAQRLPHVETPPAVERVRVAIIGRPNVGKSTLVNALLGQDRVIVSDVGGTTRDAIDVGLETPQGSFTLVDTAGIRRPGKRGRGVERHSVMRATAAVERADVAVLLIDGAEGVTAQDTHIASIAVDAVKGLVIAVNKTDLWEADVAEKAEARYTRWLQRRFRFVPWAMLVFISAAERRGLDRLLEVVTEAREARRRRVQTSELNAVIRRAVRSHAPPVVHHKRLKVKYVTQAAVDPPTFVFFVNDPAIVHFSYRRFLERTIRQAFDFEGTAVKLVFRASSDEDGQP